MTDERFLALDFGKKRVGVAVSDPLGLTARALAFIPNNSKLLACLSDVLAEYSVETVVLGLPLALSGEETEMSGLVREFAKQLQEKFGCKIVFQDERLSSKAVDRHLIAMDIRRDQRKRLVDSQAAAFILESFLEKRRLSG